MSVEFSGQITTAGAGRLPAATCFASETVAAAWFSVTVLARSRFGRLRACGTFPCTVAITAVGPGPDGGDHTRLPASTAATTTAASTAAVATLTRSAGRAADPGAAPQASAD